MDGLEAAALENVVNHVLLHDALLVLGGLPVVVDAGGVPRSVAVLVAAQQHHGSEVLERTELGQAVQRGLQEVLMIGHGQLF